MKFLFALLVLSTAVHANPTSGKKTLPVTKDDQVVKKEMQANEKLKMLDQKEEDCDDKAKKVVEIKPETISLSGNTGCSLDDAH